MPLGARVWQYPGAFHRAALIRHTQRRSETRWATQGRFAMPFAGVSRRAAHARVHSAAAATKRMCSLESGAVSRELYPLGVALAHPAERSLEVPRVPFRTGIPRTLAARPVTSKCCRQPRSAAACCPAACCWCGGSPAVGRPAIAVEPLLAAAAAKSHAPSPHLRRAARRTEAKQLRAIRSHPWDRCRRGDALSSPRRAAQVRPSARREQR